MGVPRDIIKHEAQSRIDQVLSALRIDATSRGGYVTLCNPVRGEKRPSMQIWLKPGYEGAWMDHTDRDRLKGDVFDLVAYLNGWRDEADRGFAKAAAWLSATLGLDHSARPQANTEALRQAQAQRAREADAASEKNRSRALAIFLKGIAIEDTPAERYLAARGVDYAKLKRPPHSLRYLARHLHRESEQELPCMVALMQGGDGRPRAVHRTWLREDGSAKADVDPPRKIWPHFAGSIIALARGASGLSVKDACEAGIADTLVLAEGIEDGLSFAIADASVRVWAVGSIGNLAHVPVPSCATDIIVSVDNDWGKAEAAASLKRGLDHLASFGVPVVTVRSPIGKDANDLIRGGM